MQLQQLFMFQLLGAVAVGSFVGEFFRSSRSQEYSARIFLANFLAGSFLSFLVAYSFYLITNLKELSLIIGAGLSYQDERFISRLMRKMIKNWVDQEVDE